MNEKYIISWGKEALWAVAIGVIGYVATELATQDLDTIEWESFTVAVATGSGRLAIAILLNSVRSLFGG
jgi:hypothetical protein